MLWFLGHKIGDRPLLLLGALADHRRASSSSRWASSASSSPTRTTRGSTRTTCPSARSSVDPRRVFRPLRDAEVPEREPRPARAHPPLRRRRCTISSSRRARSRACSRWASARASSPATCRRSSPRSGSPASTSRADDLARAAPPLPAHQGAPGQRLRARRASRAATISSICAEVLEHLDAPERALDEMLRARAAAAPALGAARAVLHALEPRPREERDAASATIPSTSTTGARARSAKLLETRLTVLRMTTSYPWILALAAPR